jgi:hypothetical protein
MKVCRRLIVCFAKFVKTRQQTRKVREECPSPRIRERQIKDKVHKDGIQPILCFDLWKERKIVEGKAKQRKFIRILKLNYSLEEK